MPHNRTSSNDLTNSEYWDRVWIQEKRKSRISMALRYQSTRKTRQMFLHLLNETKMDEADLFEIGCAPGTMLKLFKELKPNFRLHGIDYADEGIEITTRGFSSDGIDAKIHLGDVREFISQDRFDIVTSHGFIEHFEDVTEIVEQHKRLAKPGGYVLITIPNYSPVLVRHLIRRFDPQALKVHNLDIMHRDKLLKVMTDVGLEKVRVGWDGGPKLRSVASKRDFASHLYLFISHAWNVIAGYLPKGVGWQATIWGIGQLPDSIEGEL